MNQPVTSWLRVSDLGCWVLVSFILLGWPSLAHADTARWKTRTKELAAYFPVPGADSGAPTLVIMPLFGPGIVLLPGGKLAVWVGRTDGIPVANASVTFRVPADGNALVSAGGRVAEVTRQTNADGIAEARLTAPDVPKPRNDPNGGGNSE